MTTRKPTPATIAAEIRHLLGREGSAEHATGVQWFFKDEIKSHGWYTAELRSTAIRFRRRIREEFGLDFLLQVAGKLFSGHVLEEKVFAVFLLEKLTKEFGDTEFSLFESWLDRISSWADHDGLVHYLIAPMVAAQPSRSRRVFLWAKSARPLASAGGLCCLDPGNAAEDVFRRDHSIVRFASFRRRGHGAKRIGLAPARNRES
jgi:hypothetical protein